MASRLVIVPQNKLQQRIDFTVSHVYPRPCVYVSLNKSKKGSEENFLRKKIPITHLYFVDCMTSENLDEGSIHIEPHRLDLLITAIMQFFEELRVPPTVVVDAFSTLLIYNSMNSVAQFVKSLVDSSANKQIELIAFSPESPDDQLLQKVYNFFDFVQY